MFEIVKTLLVNSFLRPMNLPWYIYHVQNVYYKFNARWYQTNVYIKNTLVFKLYFVKSDGNYIVGGFCDVVSKTRKIVLFVGRLYMARIPDELSHLDVIYTFYYHLLTN